MKEKKNNPKLAVDIMQEIERETMHQECFILTLLSCFDRLANSVIFPAEFCVFVFNKVPVAFFSEMVNLKLLQSNLVH